MSFWCISTNGLITAISNAVTLGRNNLGCVLVASTGNYAPASIFYPANSPNVIAVGSIDRNGRRSSFSQYGSEIDLVAPGRDIYTTCMLGASDYTIINNGANGVYTSDFTGTSAACPHVSGIAALLISLYRNLTWTQVKYLMVTSCTKLSSYAFSNNPAHPNSSWNNEVGYGLVSAYGALSFALPRYVGRFIGDYSGYYIAYAGSGGGSVSVNLYAFPLHLSLSFTWSAQFYGNASSAYLSTNFRTSSRASFSDFASSTPCTGTVSAIFSP